MRLSVEFTMTIALF